MIHRVLLCLALLPATVAAQPRVDSISLADAADEAKPKLSNNIAVARKAATGISALADKKPPKSLDAKEREVYGKQTAFFKRTAGQLRGLATRAEALLAKSKSQKDDTSTAAVQEMNLEFVALQTAVQDESRKFADYAAATALLTNILKEAHRQAMALIQNIKA